MDELMDWLFESLTLRTRALRGATLTSTEGARLLALARAFERREGTARPQPRSQDGTRGAAEREGQPIPVQLTAPGGFESARLVHADGDGMKLALARPLRLGEATIVRVISPRSGVEYTFPCRVESVEGNTMSVLFDGAPSRTPLREALQLGWRRPLDLRTGWGRRPELAAA